MNRFNSNFTVEETNLLSIYMTGSKEGLVVPSFSVRSCVFAPFRFHRGFGTLPNKQFLTDKPQGAGGKKYGKGTPFLCLL